MGVPIPEARCYASVTVPGRVESIRFAAGFIVQFARHMQVPAAFDAMFETAIVEALNNAVEHGTADERPEASVACELELVGQRFTVRILDQGPGFVLPQTPQPEWNPDETAAIPEGGYGFSLHEPGGFQETPLAGARRTTEGARQGQLRSAAGASDELAALRARTDPNLRAAGANAVDIAIDDDPESPTYQQEIFVRRPEAPGMRPGARPRAPGPERVPRAPAGTVIQAIGKAVTDALEEGGVAIDENSRGAIVSRGIQLMNDPASGFAGDPIGAGQAAAAEALTTGKREERWFGMRSPRLVVPPGAAPGQRAAGAIAGPAPGGKPIPGPQRTSGGALPPEAVARLKEGVATRFANGQVWTLQGGQPVQVP